MSITAQVNLAMTRASVCLGTLTNQQAADLAVYMQGVATALEDDARIPWAFMPFIDRSDRCQLLASSGAWYEQGGYLVNCQDWEGAIVHALNLLAAKEREYGCHAAAEVTEAAAEGVSGESQAAGEIPPSIDNLEIPTFVKTGSWMIGGAAVLLLLVSLR